MLDRFSCLHRIEYPLRGSDVDITLVMGSETFVLPNSNGVVFIYKFEVNRILTWKALQQLVKCKAVTYRRDFPAGATAIVDTGAEQVEVYQPFSKTPVLLRSLVKPFATLSFVILE